MIKLEIQAIGDSEGVVLPDEVLSRLDLKVGDAVLLIETKNGYQLRPPVRKMAERIMSEHHQTMKKLADS